jgi:hypothetical protein
VLCRFQNRRISIANLKHPRWVKLGILFYATVEILKQTFLLTERTQKENKKNKILSLKSNKNKTNKSKNYQVASHKAVSL